MSFKYP